MVYDLNKKEGDDKITNKEEKYVKTPTIENTQSVEKQMVWKSFVLLYYSSKYVKQRFNLSLVTKVSRQSFQNTYLAGKKTYINFLISLQ